MSDELEPLEPTTVDLLADALSANADLGDVAMFARVLTRSFGQALPPDANIVEETTTTRIFLQRHLPHSQPGRYFARMTAGLGVGLSVACGVKTARPNDVTVAILGDGDTDLDLYVYDENGNEIVSDTDGTDQCYVSWYPKWAGQFRIEIKNLGRVSNQYCLALY